MIKDKNTLIVLGMFSLVIAILLGRYAEHTAAISFFEGMFYGLSLVFNIFYLILARKSRTQK